MPTKKTLIVLILFAVGTECARASQINRITLAELQDEADIIVMAKVTKVVKDGDRDNITIQVDSYLKGESPQTVYTFALVTRGVKDFDPALETGDSGVFFLKRKDREGQVEKAYWGGVATFQQNHFDLTAAKETSRDDRAAELKSTEKQTETRIAQRPAWPLTREPIQGRLAIENHFKSGPGSNVLLVLEVRNNSNNRADVAFTPVDLKVELFDADNKPIKRVRPPGLGPAPAPRQATIASGDYAGFSVSHVAISDPPDSGVRLDTRFAISGDPDPGVRLDSGWDYWLLQPGTYRVRGSATVTLQQKTGTAEAGPRKIALPLSEVILEIPK